MLNPRQSSCLELLSTGSYRDTWQHPAHFFSLKGSIIHLFIETSKLTGPLLDLWGPLLGKIKIIWAQHQDTNIVGLIIEMPNMMSTWLSKNAKNFGGTSLNVPMRCFWRGLTKTRSTPNVRINIPWVRSQAKQKLGKQKGSGNELSMLSLRLRPPRCVQASLHR